LGMLTLQLRHCLGPIYQAISHAASADLPATAFNSRPDLVIDPAIAVAIGSHAIDEHGQPGNIGCGL